ncbi:PTS transporter subunit IIC [Candidatus Mycoplasma pogonae]
MVISPATQQRYMRQIVGNNEIGLGHTGGFGYAVSGLIGEGIAKISKKKILSTEEIKFPQSLFFFRNTLVSISLTLFLFYLFAFLPAGIMFEMGKFHQEVDGQMVVIETKKAVVEVLTQQNWLVTMLVQAFTFTAGVEIILSGVRMFVGELVPMFKGISDKFIKNAKAAVDCPVVYPYAPNAVIIGFISSFLGGIVGMFITIGLNQGSLIGAVILPGLVPHFFLGATQGVFGNVKGGIIGAVLGSFIMGIFITFVPVIFMAGKWVPGSNDALVDLALQNGVSKNDLVSLNWGDTDYIFGIIPGLFGLISKWAILAVSLVMFIAVLLDGVFAKFVPWWPKGRKPKTESIAHAA